MADDLTITPDSPPPTLAQRGLVPYSSLTVEHVDWLIAGHVPHGMLTVLAGEQGLGKSLLHARWAADLSREGIASILVSAEDSPTHTTKARLHAAQAIQEIIYHASILPVLGNGSDPMWLRRMTEWIVETGAKFLVLDPLAAFIDANSDSYKDQHVRRILSALDTVARETGCAIVYVMHLTKGTGSNPLQRIQGSIAFTAAARSVLLMHPEISPQEPSRILAHVKCNVAEKALPQRWEVEPILIPDLAGRDVRTARLTYKGIAEGIDVFTMLAPRELEDDKSEREQAKEIIVALVGVEGVPSRDLERAVRESGISSRTYDRARIDLGVRAVKRGKVWYSMLSQSKDANGKDATEDGVLDLPLNHAEEFGF